jgi:hypothetical protein
MMRHLQTPRFPTSLPRDTIAPAGLMEQPPIMRFPSPADRHAVLSFLTTHCGPRGSNPLSLLSAAQLVSDLRADEVAALQQALHGVRLEATLAALIEHRAATG